MRPGIDPVPRARGIADFADMIWHEIEKIGRRPTAHPLDIPDLVASHDDCIISGGNVAQIFRCPAGGREYGSLAQITRQSPGFEQVKGGVSASKEMGTIRSFRCGMAKINNFHIVPEAVNRL
jgi:hypothetical protein